LIPFVKKPDSTVNKVSHLRRMSSLPLCHDDDCQSEHDLQKSNDKKKKIEEIVKLPFLLVANIGRKSVRDES